MLEHILSFLIGIPLFSATLLLLCRVYFSDTTARYIALCSVLSSSVICAILYWHFDSTLSVMQFQEHVAWIPDMHIAYDLGVDGVSLLLVMLTTVTSFVVILSSWSTVKENVAAYLALFLLMQSMVTGVFCALDALLFYFFWEAMLIPMYLSIGIWGGVRRSYAAMKFFIYTFVGSALMLIALLYLGNKAHSYYIPDFFNLALSLKTQCLLFGLFFLSFAIKVPMWPFHTWLPDVHTEAPTGGSVVLAALMLKLGAYGFLRFNLPILPDASSFFAWPMVILSLIAIVYIAFIALAQKDLKKLIAYSSVAHMGFVTLGCFLIYLVSASHYNIPLNTAHFALTGAVIQMLTHAFGSGALFLGFGILYQKMQTRLLSDFSGVAYKMPVFAAFFMLFALTNLAFPGTSGFVGEFMILLAAAKTSFVVLCIAGTSVVLSASYTLLMYKKVFWGTINTEKVAGLQDIGSLECFIFMLLSAFILFLGLYPEPLFTTLHSSVDQILHYALHSKIAY